MDIQCFQKDAPNCIKVFVNNIKGYARKIKAYPLVNRKDKSDTRSVAFNEVESFDSEPKDKSDTRSVAFNEVESSDGESGR